MIVPEEAVPEKFTVITCVLFPEIIAAPEGNVQEYEVAFVIEATENCTPFWPAQTADEPVITPAITGKGFTVTGNDEETPSPHKFCPFTEIVPLAADGKKLTRILEVVCPDIIDAPNGTVQR